MTIQKQPTIQTIVGHYLTMDYLLKIYNTDNRGGVNF